MAFRLEVLTRQKDGECHARRHEKMVWGLPGGDWGGVPPGGNQQRTITNASITFETSPPVIWVPPNKKIFCSIRKEETK